MLSAEFTWMGFSGRKPNPLAPKAQGQCAKASWEKNDHLAFWARD